MHKVNALLNSANGLTALCGKHLIKRVIGARVKILLRRLLPMILCLIYIGTAIFVNNLELNEHILFIY